MLMAHQLPIPRGISMSAAQKAARLVGAVLVILAAALPLSDGADPAGSDAAAGTIVAGDDARDSLIWG
jgi:hypothetical protein